MFTLVPVSSRLVWPVLAVALLAAGCASVDLGPRYDPPPVHMPPATPAPASQAQGAMPQPVPPTYPQAQPLPPIGSTAPMPSPPPVVQAPPEQPAPSPRSNLVTLTTRLDSASTVPPARSAAVGQLDALYDCDSGLLRWKASWSSLSGPIASVQFHAPAEMGQIAPPALVWPGPFGPSYEGRAVITPQQATDLLSGRWYLNLTTRAYPTGELRGQLRVVY